MSIWPIIISLAILAIAYVIFYMLPSLTDGEQPAFVWIVGLFFVVYIGIAFYMSKSLPSPSELVSTQNSIDLVQSQ